MAVDPSKVRERIEANEAIPVGVKQTQESGQMATFHGVKDRFLERALWLSVERGPKRRKGTAVHSKGGLD